MFEDYKEKDKIREDYEITNIAVRLKYTKLAIEETLDDLPWFVKIVSLDDIKRTIQFTEWALSDNADNQKLLEKLKEYLENNLNKEVK